MPTNVRLHERPAGCFMLRCDSQDLTLQAILSNAVTTVRQTLRRMFSAMAAEGAKERCKLVLRPPLKRAVTRCKQRVGVEPLFMLRCDRSPVMLTWLRTIDQHPPTTDAFTPRSGYGWSRAKHGNQAG